MVYKGVTMSYARNRVALAGVSAAIVTATVMVGSTLFKKTPVVECKEEVCPARLYAAEALNGKHGKLEEWQRVGYTRILQNGVRRERAWVTHYWTGEPGVGTVTASGRRVEAGRTAAMLEPRKRFGGMPYGKFVLLKVDGSANEWILRQVWDTGSTRNKYRAAELMCTTWVDLYMPKRTPGTKKADAYIENW